MFQPSGSLYTEYYLYSSKRWEVVPSGVNSYVLAAGVMQNAPVVVTSSGYETTLPSDPWAQVSGFGKWRKKAYGHFTVDASGFYDESMEEFTLNPDSSGRLQFNKTLVENVFVEYESGPSGYYYLDTINVNPIMRETDSGFLQIAKTDKASNLSLKATQSSIRGDGNQRSMLLATLYDDSLNKLENEKIIFEMMFNINDDIGPEAGAGYLVPGRVDGDVHKVHPSGFVCETFAYTDRMGQASADFKAFEGKSGWSAFKAYYAEASGIYDTAEVLSYKAIGGMFILDYSMLDGLDYLGDVSWTPSGIPGEVPED